jgi:hypothetical protein
MTRQEELNEAWCKYRGKCSTEIMQALAFALRWCNEHPHWISVEDKLPPLRQGVLAYNGVTMYIAWVSDDFVWRTHKEHCFRMYPVTHWMPLPLPPHHFADVSKMVKKGGER